MKLFTVYEHKENGQRIAYLGISVSAHVRAVARRRRRILQAAEMFQFSSFFTLTYDDRLIDGEVKEFYKSKHVRDCLHRIRSYFRKYSIPQFEYVWVLEFGELLGRPHWHILSTIDYYSSVLHNSLPRWWGYGFVKVKKLNNDYHVRSYIHKYLAKQDVQAQVRTYGTSRGIPATPQSKWKRLCTCTELDLEVLVDEWNERFLDVQLEIAVET